MKDEKYTPLPRRPIGLDREELKKRTVTAPDGQTFEVDPIRDYYCQDAPKAHQRSYIKIVEDFFNWCRAESLWILGYGTGCGAIEMRPLMTPRFDAYRYGIQWRPTPRQANLLMISGYLSVKTLKRAIRSYEQMQNPKYVVGLGSCTINGGMYWDSYNTIKKLDEYLPVDLYIAGCMPRPEALLAGFEDLKKIIKAGGGEGANKYAENFEWYKANQKSVIKDWDMPDYNW
ncbi:NADH-quinone oxidoreductase subunit NuoB [Aliiroseovarius subalbicans]|uniref:NADH-quinone oxidoreductase subunit B n=1 Tax=Aliiroseovarius subalbicans TaxID=2925840 RepID=UPI001F575CCF|nr:NADH-quinone oxidoreductase subunit NuoB [Aliiroseovarius subalbicans]MCI2400857.1 NADH-quinone oxidoreductase subunit NuoB [Aliiroseovarius subalbicans]